MRKAMGGYGLEPSEIVLIKKDIVYIYTVNRAERRDRLPRR